MATSPEVITSLGQHQVFVFGSNLSGLHLGGAARQALKWGAINGKHNGHYGQTYAIPTVGHNARGTLSPAEIIPFVNEFIKYASNHPELEFLVTEIGCGIAGLTHEEVAPLFTKAKEQANILLPNRFVNSIS